MYSKVRALTCALTSTACVSKQGSVHIQDPVCEQFGRWEEETKRATGQQENQKKNQNDRQADWLKATERKSSPVGHDMVCVSVPPQECLGKVPESTVFGEGISSSQHGPTFCFGETTKGFGEGEESSGVGVGNESDRCYSYHHCPTGCPGASPLPMPCLKALKIPTSAPSGATELNEMENFPAFQNAPSGSKDRWRRAEWGGKMLLVREHPTVRINKFHPLHKTNPVDTACLGDARCTIAFDVETGEKMVWKDDWKDRPERGTFRWMGFTIFVMNEDEAANSGYIATQLLTKESKPSFRPRMAAAAAASSKAASGSAAVEAEVMAGKAPPLPLQDVGVGASVDVSQGTAMSAMMPPPVPMVVNYGYLNMGRRDDGFPQQPPMPWDVMSNVGRRQLVDENLESYPDELRPPRDLHLLGAMPTSRPSFQGRPGLNGSLGPPSIHSGTMVQGQIGSPAPSDGPVVVPRQPPAAIARGQAAMASTPKTFSPCTTEWPRQQ